MGVSLEPLDRTLGFSLNRALLGEVDRRGGELGLEQ
jgi:hypothetical protein